MKVKVKICGIKNYEMVKTAVDAGADFLGFNFVSTSKRFIEPERAREIIDVLNNYLCHCGSQTKQSLLINRDRHVPIKSGLAMTNRVKVVGVFQNEKIDDVNKLINDLKLDYVQLHGSESPDYTSRINNARVIKTFSLPFDFNTEVTINKMKKYKADYFLLDREKQGEGTLLNPDKVCQLTVYLPIILAGGLTVENVGKLVRLVHPQGVDVAGGVETNGEKNSEKIYQFIKNAKQYE